MQSIVINDKKIIANESGLFDLEVVFQALDTDEFIRNTTLAGRVSYFPHRYLASDSARDVAMAVVAQGRQSFLVDNSPNGGSFVCRELLLDYARRRNAGLYVYLLQQLFEHPVVLKNGKLLSRADSEMLNLFFDAFFDINDSMDDGLNHSHNPDLIAINIGQSIKVLKLNGIDLPYRNDLINVLKRDSSYLGNKCVKSKVWKQSTWCFLFKRG
jgi:hypothetical protein